MPRKKKRILDASVTAPDTRHGFVNGFFFVFLWDVIMCLRSSRRIANGHQVARLGGVRGIWRWKATENRAGTAKSHALRTPIADSRRLFAEATSRRCSRSAISTVGPQVYCQWANLTQVPGSSNRRGRLSSIRMALFPRRGLT